MWPTDNDTGARLLRVTWKPGTRSLHGECWCGLVRDSPDPITLWDWMDHHDHRGDDDTTPPPPPRDAALASRHR